MALKISQMAEASSLDGTELLEVSKLSATVSITANTISALASDKSFNDSGSGFIAAGFAVGDQVNVSGMTGNVANNIYSFKIGALTASKMTPEAPAGDVIVNDAAGESVTITKWETYRTDAASLAAAGADVAAQIHAATGKTTPVDADELGIVDSAASNVLKKLTWANLKATLKTYFDTLYQAVGSYLPTSYLDTDSTLAANSDSKIASQKATKSYVDNKIAGLSWKTPAARAATTAALPANTYSNGTSGVGATLTGNSNGALTVQDGVTLVANDILLVKNEATGANNGRYTLTQVGSGGTPYILTRTTDADSSAELVNASMYVSEGTTLADTQWTCSTNAPITVGSTSLTFAQFSSGGVSSVNSQTGSVSLNAGYLGVKGADIASATTTDIGAATGDFVDVTGTTTITGLGTIAAGVFRVVRFTGALTLTHNATSLILPTGANVTTAAGDVATFRSLGSGNWVCIGYMRANGQALAGSSGSTKYRKVFRPRDNEPPTSNFATLDTRNNHPVLDFDTTTQEAAIFSDVISAAYGGGNITVTVLAALTSATSGTLGWDVTFERLGSSQDIDSDGFATAQTITATTVPGSSGQLIALSVTITAGSTGTDSLAAGEAYRLRIRRDVANDTATGDAELLAVVVSED